MRKLRAPIGESWLDEASALLHDSLVSGERRDRSGSGRYELELQRVGYEHGRRESRWLGLLRRWRLPRVPTLLRVEPVVEVHATGSAAEGPELDQLLGLRLDGPSTLVLSRDFGQTRIELGPGARLSVEDRGEPSDRRSVTDIGGRLVNRRWIAELETRRGAR
jgi:hypothetical protein